MNDHLFRPRTFTCAQCGEKLPELVVISVPSWVPQAVLYTEGELKTKSGHALLRVTVRCAGVGCCAEHVYAQYALAREK